MTYPLLIAGPKKIVGGRFAISASLYQFEDGRVLQGLTGCHLDAREHAAWRHEQGHASDIFSDSVCAKWPEVAAMREP